MSMAKLADCLSQQYRAYGYTPYTMSKFEEYELYLRNKDFLISDRVLTFTDTDGKLMALKPDVTLSIIKNTVDLSQGVQKLYYQENVYRPNDQGFREIMQLGLECMGDVDDYCILEVMLLAVSSLRAIGGNCVLDVSHMGLLSHLLQQYAISVENEQKILEAISSKNVPEIKKICNELEICDDRLARIATLSGKYHQVLPELEKIFQDDPELEHFLMLLRALEQLGADCIHIDFSVVNDMSYYNGIVFRGFVEGVPDGVLSGGQYDGLMKKMKRMDKAIGFALYPDLLKHLIGEENPCQADTLLLYAADSDICVVADKMREFARQGIQSRAEKIGMITEFPGTVYQVKGNEVIRVEANA